MIIIKQYYFCYDININTWLIKMLNNLLSIHNTILMQMINQTLFYKTPNLISYDRLFFLIIINSVTISIL